VVCGLQQRAVPGCRRRHAALRLLLLLCYTPFVISDITGPRGG
jgi:hypothetical protein